MESLLYDHIKNLQKNRTTWRLKVRVTRIWQTISSENGSVRGYNLILMDDDNSHVHAYIFPDNSKAIGRDVVEGHIYTFQNFIVRDTVGRFKPVSTNLGIRLLDSTFIHRVEDDGIVPHYKFEFMDLADLEEEMKHLRENENPEFTAYLIGVINEYEKTRLLEEGFKSPGNPEKITEIAIIPSIERLSLKDLNDSYSTLNVKKKVCCTFKILRIEDVDNWWYYSCQKCKVDVQKEGNEFRCESCKKNWTFAEKRFRLIVLAEDTTLTTDILMDRVVKRLAGNTATHYLNKKDVRSEDIPIPDILNELFRKK
ncbi:uncharacterized protein LOC141690648 [Apium graveolens]|uniref:uncharacterized protein LOC141690648 n=1 Tax=Apium graveolens TaxID=4045 RepID=UPI003D7BDB62